MRHTIAFYVSSVPIGLDQRDGRASLGGSESACFGLARALARQGHRVHIHAQHLAEDARGVDADGVTWHDAGPEDAAVYDWCEVVEPDVFVSLRMPHVFRLPVRARFRALWNQDMLVPAAAGSIATIAWQLDAIVYVSEYHRKQWQGVSPDLARIPSYVTRNGFDPAHVPTDVAKVPGRICYITRPERGLAPLLEMWPAVKAAVPHAELHVTRYGSMYDGEGSSVAQMCKAYDELTARVHAEVGGIVTYAGGLGKADLYRLIASSEVMWYPGVVDFAETSCCAAIEAQACGTAFVGSRKGALPETVPNGSLLDGDASTAEYQQRSIAAVRAVLEDDDQGQSNWDIVSGLAHVQRYTYDAIAADWSTWLDATFQARYEADTPGVLRQLLQYDDHVPALRVAEAIGEANAADRAHHYERGAPPQSLNLIGHRDPDKREADLCAESFECVTCEAIRAAAFCRRVIAGEDQTAEDYGDRAMPDPMIEAETSARLQAAAAQFAGATRVLDVACGNGAFSLLLAQQNPDVRIVAIDYSAANIAKARETATRVGVAGRVTFVEAAVYDFGAQASLLTQAVRRAWHKVQIPFDGVFIGEFLEHIADPASLLTDVATLAPGGRVVCTMPSGPWTELMPHDVPIKRGHVHHYAYDDVQAIFGAQTDMQVGVLAGGRSPRGSAVASWVISYTADPAIPLGARDLTHRIVTTRPMPRLSIGMIVKESDYLELPRCLATVRDIADEIVIGVCGPGPSVLAIAEDIGARVVTLPAVADLPGGFAEARNRILDVCTGEWFLWIDADEQLVGSTVLRQYLDTTYFDGFSVRQQHLQIDADRFYDEPIRLFRRASAARFCGVVHEQPQTTPDGNGDLWPVLGLIETQIAHYGYLVEGVRRTKSQRRNLPLLLRDRQQFPDRELGRVLWMREFATWLSELAAHRPTYVEGIQTLVREAGGSIEVVMRDVFDGQPIPMSGEALARFAADYYERHFPDPTTLRARLARPFYEAALRVLPEAWHVDYAFAAQQGGLRGRAKPKPFWTRSAADMDAMLRLESDKLRQAMAPVMFDVEPYQAPSPAPVLQEALTA